MTGTAVGAPMTAAAFIARLRAAGEARYHHRHPFHLLMHSGQLPPHQLRQWVVNRYYYQTRIPIKDALILSKTNDSEFRRVWIHRIMEQDGIGANPGGLALWLRLAEGVGLDLQAVRQCRDVLPGVREACDRYVQCVREWTLLEAVASSLTELFAPQLMSQRIAAWEHHYPWIAPGSLDYFRRRVRQADADANMALTYVLTHTVTGRDQDLCLEAWTEKATILWGLLDAVYADCI
jgi:pyrroloquinoline-quinone synthase